MSRRVLKEAVARNRVKRLIRETFRQQSQQFKSLDMNVIGRARLSEVWGKLELKDIEALFSKFADVVRNKNAGKPSSLSV